ncbi:MAG: tetratricopeptide repeat protein, partial [Opitutaceae bacterium]
PPRRSSAAPRAAAAASEPVVAAPAPATAPVKKSSTPLLAGIGVAAALIAAFLLWRGRTDSTTSVAEKSTTASAAVPRPTAVPSLGEKSVAVLPFANLSAESENEFFADGVHEDVITHLSKVRELAVISRGSVLLYRDQKARDLRRIAEDLGVANIVEGSVRRVGNQVKVSAQLIEARTGRSLWAENYPGELTDVFALQARLAREIAAALKVSLTVSERALIDRRPTEDLAAYDLLRRARLLEEARTQSSSRDSYEQAAVAYEQVLARDPSLLAAHVGLTRLHGIMFWYGYLDPSPARRAKLEAAALATERAGPGTPESHIARGALEYFGNNNWPGALAHYREAEKSLPNDQPLQFLLAFTHRRLGNWNEAVRYMERSVALNPNDLNITSQLAVFYLILGRQNAGLALAERCAARFPKDVLARHVLARARFDGDGKLDAFIRTLESLPPTDNDAHGIIHRYSISLLKRDFDAAENALNDPRLTGITDPWTVVIAEPVAFHRAKVAFLAGRTDDCHRHAREALEAFRTTKWTPRQMPYVALGICETKAFLGLAAEVDAELPAAVREARRADAFGGREAEERAARTQLILGRTAEAIAQVRNVLGDVAPTSPQRLQADPFWSPLKNDPRFAEAIRSARKQ